MQGLNDILVNFARCCHPLPGDSIVGYITRGRGVTVHTTECLSVDKLEYDPERRVEVEWDVQQETTHPARITVVTHDQQGVLAGVSSAIAACNGNISRASVTTSQDKKAYLEFTVDIRDITPERNHPPRGKLAGSLVGERVKNTPPGQMASLRGQDAFCTLPERKQRVQILIRLAPPEVCTRIRCKFGFQRRFVRLWAWLMVWP